MQMVEGNSMKTAGAISPLSEGELDLVTGGHNPLVYVGPTNVSVQTIVGIAAVGVVLNVSSGGTTYVSIIGVKATIHQR